jgi:hypothetical protein
LTGATGCKGGDPAGGSVEARNRPQGGLLVTITLPGARLKKYRQEAIDNDWHLT